MQRWLLTFDVASVFLFVIAGRSNHGASEDPVSVLHTAGPFLIALGVGWLMTRAWRDPMSVRTGFGVAAVTVAGGVVLRRLLFSDGIALSFIVVTALVLTLFIVGWRLGANAFARREAAGAGS